MHRVLLRIKDHCDSKVGQLDFSVLGCKDVSTLDITVDAVLRVKELKALQNLVDVDDH